MRVLNPSVPIQRYFEEISQIPRNSREEGKIARYLIEFAQTRGLEAWEEELHNVVIKKPGSLGCESLPPVMLQAHVDMVCVKAPGSPHDFANDPIELVVEGDILRAKDTSLGADDGFGVAYMLAILDDATLKHPPLTPLGEGSHNWQPIAAACESSGVKWVFAEQEQWDRDAFECSTVSFCYLNKVLNAGKNRL